MDLTNNYWDMANWEIIDEDSEGYVLFEIPTSFSGSEEVSYEIENACDVAIGTVTLYEGICGGYFMMMAPNPASTETTLSIETTSTAETFDENEEWELEVYDQVQSLKEKKTKLRGKSTKIQTNGWKEGVYVVRAKYKDKILTGKLVVKQ
jgi:hypothetical protein